MGLKDHKYGNSIICAGKGVTVDICFDNNEHKGNPVYVLVFGDNMLVQKVNDKLS